MATEIAFTDKNCGGVSVRDDFGRRTPYKRPERGAPVVTMPDAHAEQILKAGTPGVERHRGRSYSIPAPWIPDRPLPGRPSAKDTDGKP
jgi:hypothetical protein